MCANESSNPSAFDKLVFNQDLNEVYLLLDFISGRPDKHFADLENKIFDPTDPEQKRKFTASQVIEYVSRLRFPPSDVAQDKARDAAFLLLVKDALNAIAFPARGMTIAYTTMFTDSGKPTDVSRLQAAFQAYPTLCASATRFRRVKAALVWFALFITVLSATLLWQVTYGAQLAVRFDEAKRNDTATAAKLYDALDKTRVRKSDGGATAGSENGATSIEGHDLNTICGIGSETSDAKQRGSDIQQLCNEYAYRHAQLCVAIADIGTYGQFWLFRTITAILPIHDPSAALNCGSGEKGAAGKTSAPGKWGRQEDTQSIAGVLAMMSNYLLPILFGLVGTLAAFVRGVQDKVTESVLSPRDRALAFIRLPLGMMAGVCVGLFLSPASVASQTAGNFTISASGIAFLAGYGAESFFRALDAMLSRIFTFDDKAARSSR